jgi:alpha-L-rhamnosidase
MASLPARWIALGLLIGSLAGLRAAEAPAAFTPEQPLCEYRTDPLGIDTAAPRLGWTLHAAQADARGLAQTAYHILVASSPALLAQDQGDLWDSGRVAGDAMNQIAYGGKPLASDEACWWKVEVWDQAGRKSAWSPAAAWTMGVLAPDDWAGAKWIGANDDGQPPLATGPKPKYETVLLRREFTVKPGLRRALVDVCGLGQYEMTVNGARVGDILLAPGWSQYEKTCLYDVYDITALLQPGPNAAGVFLGNGPSLCHGGRFNTNTNALVFFAPAQAVVRIRLEYANGTETVVSDGQWKAASGPITFSSMYGGEDYDARLETPGWDRGGFADAAWEAPKLMDGPIGTLRGLSCAAPPVRGFESLKPIAKKEIKPGVTVYDLGQNASVIARIKVHGSAGAKVRVIPAELVHPDGTVDRGSAGGGDAWWQYTLAGREDGEEYMGKFFYQGARYLQVERLPSAEKGGLPTVESVEAVVIHADCPPVGTFTCSNDLFNKTYALTRWAQQNNMVSLMTDCPTREKRGWLEQDHLNGPALRYNFFLAALFTKAVNDMIDAQRPEGLIPSTSPDYARWHDAFADSPEWGSAIVLVPWQQYQFDGDVELLRRGYAAMTTYQAFLAKKAQAGIAAPGLGDWYDIGPNPPGGSQLTPTDLTATAFYYQNAVLLHQIAALLGKDEDAQRDAAQAAAIAAAFQKRFYHAETHQYGSGKQMGSQCANALALVMGLVPEGDRAAVLDNVVRDVAAKGLTAGDVGYRYLLRALADGGRSDVIYAMNNQSAKPGYGMMVRLGKTALTEGWDGGSSQDHFMLGQINEWFYGDLAGIQPDPEGPGFAKVVIKPAFVEGIDMAAASYRSIRGPITSEWKRDGGTISLHVVIPPNVAATLSLATPQPEAVKESGLLAERSPGVRLLRRDAGAAVYAVASGDYTFTAPAPVAP